MESNARFHVMHSVQSSTVQVHLHQQCADNKRIKSLTPWSLTVLSLLCSHSIFIHFFFLSFITFSLISCPSSHFTTRGSRRRCDWQACAVSPVETQHRQYPSYLSFPGWQMGFLCRSTPSPSLSPQIGEGVGEGRDRWDSVNPTLPMTNDSDADKQCTVSVRLCLELRQCFIVYHTLLSTNHAHDSLAGALVEKKRRTVPVRACPWFTIIISIHSAALFCLPALKVGVFDSKPN